MAADWLNALSLSVGPKLVSAKRTIRVIKCVFILISIICLFDVMANVIVIGHGGLYRVEIPFNVSLFSHIMKSLFMITLMVLLLSWIHQSDSSWCHCLPESVCCCLCGCTLCSECCRGKEMSSRSKHFKYYEDQNVYTNLSLETATPHALYKRTTGEMNEIISTVASTTESTATTLSHSESVPTASTLLLADESMRNESSGSFVSFR